MRSSGPAPGRFSGEWTQAWEACASSPGTGRDGEAHRPGIAEAVPGRPRSGGDRLVAVEDRPLQGHPAEPYPRHRHRPLEDLAQVMVDREQHGRPRHRIVRAERHEALPGRDEDVRPAAHEHQFVHERVRVTAVCEALAPVARGELPVRDGVLLEVRGGDETQPATQGSGVEHRHRQEDAGLAQRAVARDDVRLRECRDRLRAPLDAESLCVRSAGERERQQQHAGAATRHARVKLSRIPSTMNCTAMAQRTSPINRVRIRIPVRPSRRSTTDAAARVR